MLVKFLNNSRKSWKSCIAPSKRSFCLFTHSGLIYKEKQNRNLILSHSFSDRGNFGEIKKNTNKNSQIEGIRFLLDIKSENIENQVDFNWFKVKKLALQTFDESSEAYQGIKSFRQLTIEKLTDIAIDLAKLQQKGEITN